MIQHPLLFIPISLFLLLSLAYLVSRFELHSTLFKGIALTLPFSFETNLFGDAMISLPAEPLIGIAGLTLLIDALRQPGFTRNFINKELIWGIPLLLAFPITAMFSEIPIVSLKFTIVNVTFILVFLFFLNHILIKNPGLFPELMKLYTAGLLLVFIFALYKYWHYDWNPMVVKGIFKPFYSDYTIFGATVAVAGVFWLLYAATLPSRIEKLSAYLVSLILLLAVAISVSRAALLSLAFAAVVFVLLKLRMRLTYLAFLSVSMVLFLLVFREPIIDKLQQNTYISRSHDVEWGTNIKSAANITTDVSNLERLNRWYSGMLMFIERPVTGFGPGTYQFVYIPYQKKELMNRLTVTNPWNIPENSGGTAHSELILAMSEMGLIGLIGFILLFGRLIWIAFSGSGSFTERKLIIVGFVALSTYFFHSLFNNFLSTDKFAFLFWGMAAWLMALNIRNHEQEILS